MWTLIRFVQNHLLQGLKYQGRAERVEFKGDDVIKIHFNELIYIVWPHELSERYKNSPVFTIFVRWLERGMKYGHLTTGDLP